MNVPHRFDRRTLALLVGGLFGGIAPLAFGQVTTAASTSTTADASLDGVVVTATRRAEGIQKVPAAVTALSADEIEGAELRSTKDVARFVPSTQGWNTESRARPRFFIRGVGSNEATNNAVYPIGWYADQVYFNNNLFTGGPLYDLQRVEVLRGPQGTLWGKNTTGGALHFVSRAPSFENGGYTRAEAGSRDLRLVETAYGGRIKDDVLAGRAALHVESRGGVATNTTTGNDVGDFKDLAGRAQLLANITPSLDALVQVHGRRFDGTQNPWYSVTRGGTADRFGYLAPIGDGSGDTRHVAYNIDLPLKVDAAGASLIVNWSIDRLTLTSVTAADRGNRTTVVDSDYTPVEWPNGGGRGYSANGVTQRSQELRLASPKEDRFSWIGGLYVFQDNNDSYGASASLTGVSATQQFYYTHYRQDTKSAAAFGSASYAVTERFKVNGGLRFTTETAGIDLLTRVAAAGQPAYTVTGNWWAPDAISAPLRTYFSTGGRVANTWSKTGYDLTPEFQLTADQLVYVRHASGFKSGNYNTYINPNSALATVSQFAVVRPEKLVSYEAGYKSSWLDHRAVFNASVYHYDYRDMQLVVNQVFNAIFFPTLANAGQGKVDGVEIESALQATRELKLRANVGFLRTRFSELTAGGRSYAGYNFARVPRLTALAGADWHLPLGPGSLQLAGDLAYTSRVNFNVTDNTDPYALQGGYALTHLRAAYALQGGRIVVGAYVNNAFDRRYRTQAMLYQGALANGTGGHYPTGFGEARTIGASLTFNY